MLRADAVCIEEVLLEAGVTGTKRIIEGPAQIEMWKLLGETRVVANAVTTDPKPWQAEDRAAEAPGRADAQRKGRVGAGALDLGKSTGGREVSAGVRAPTRPAKPMVIVPARHGNAFVVRRRRD